MDELPPYIAAIDSPKRLSGKYALQIPESMRHLQFAHISGSKRDETNISIFPGGKFIPKNTGILYNIHAVNHDPALWKDPDVFRPERFLDPSTGKLNLEGQPPLLSFGLGPRTCPGEKLGQMDIFYVLVRLLQRVSFGVPDVTSSTDIKQLASSVFLMPAVQEIVLTRMN